MIHYFATGRNSSTMLSFLDSWGKELEGSVAVIPYSRRIARMDPCPGVYVFSDLEKTSKAEVASALKLWRCLKRRGDVLLLNHPEQALRRYDLLRLLFHKQINLFNVYRFREIDAVQRYPVFLRVENDHGGNRSPLLHSPEEVLVARRRITNRKKRRRLLIVEFCDTVCTDGLYRKYAAFVIAGRVVPRHIFFSRDWMIKKPDITHEELVREELSYLEENPHRREILEISRLARVDYGRIDYSLIDGKLQVWEINTNPSLASGISTATPQRAEVHRRFVEGLHEAFTELEKQERGSMNMPGKAENAGTAGMSAL